MSNTKTKKLTAIGMLCALAYIVVVVGRFPIGFVDFLKYDPKDIVIVIGGFIYGPLASFAISAVVSIVEMFTISDTGVIGMIMNIISTCSFACTAAFLYKKRHDMTGAVLGLVAGCALMAVAMVLWNYLITPLYMGYPREAVAEMLLPVFLPFNLVKGSLNAGITVLLYKPVVTALRRAHLIEAGSSKKAKVNVGAILVALFVIVTCVLMILSKMGII